MGMQEIKLLNQKWISFAREHGMVAYVKNESELGIVIEIPWWKAITQERGIFYHYCQSNTEVRAALGY
jgi:hypothetical protein